MANSWWDDFTDTAGRTIRTGWRGAVHIGGGVKDGGISGAKWGIGLSILAGMAVTAVALWALPAIAGMMTLTSWTVGISTASAFAWGAATTVAAGMAQFGPGATGRAIGAVGLAAIAVGGGMAFFAGGGMAAAAGILGGTFAGAASWKATRLGTIIGGAFGGISRIFNWPAKEVEREKGIEQYKILDARQEQQQVAEYEAEQKARLEAMQQKAKQYQMENPLAKENGGSKILNRQREQQQAEIGAGTPAMAMGG